METTQLKKIIEAALLAASRPMTVPQLEALFGDESEPSTTVGHEDIARTLEALADDCAERGIELVEVASGFRYQVRRDVHPWVARMWTERPSRYSRALLETLALIAYRQPITRGEIEQVRGVAVSSNIIKTLEEREWIRVLGHRDTPGHPALFGTTRAFLDYFNLKALDELPPLAEILNLEAMDPQLTLADPDAAPNAGTDATDANHVDGRGETPDIEPDTATNPTPSRASADTRDGDSPITNDESEAAAPDSNQPDPDRDHDAAAAPPPSAESTGPQPDAENADTANAADGTREPSEENRA